MLQFSSESCWKTFSPDLVMALLNNNQTHPTLPTFYKPVPSKEITIKNGTRIFLIIRLQKQSPTHQSWSPAAASGSDHKSRTGYKKQEATLLKFQFVTFEQTVVMSPTGQQPAQEQKTTEPSKLDDQWCITGATSTRTRGHSQDRQFLKCGWRGSVTLINLTCHHY